MHRATEFSGLLYKSFIIAGDKVLYLFTRLPTQKSGVTMKHLNQQVSYFIAIVILLGAIMLSQYEGVCRLPGFDALFNLRNIWPTKCPYCGLSVTNVSQHDLVCTTCNTHWKRCQETHTHCPNPNCKMVVDNPTAHEKKCELCGVTYLRCRRHTCHFPDWDDSRSNPTSENHPNPKRTSVRNGTASPVTNTDTDR